MPAPVPAFADNAPTTILDQITDDVVATVRSITIDNGYHQDLVVEEPNPGIGSPDRDRLAVVYQDDPRKLKGDNLYTYWEVTYAIECVVQKSQKSVEPLRKPMNMVAGDLELAMTLTETSRKRAGLAINTRVEDPDFFQASLAAHEGLVTAKFTVEFRTLIGNPFRQS